ncbi:hypothetical protein ACMHYJ_16735 [Castellaniella hirudinis]|uniref:hypothetical protein n=1 Tax=Castellaniella hirudinis TaxID=1144617 RepID=UPI0039C19920
MDSTGGYVYSLHERCIRRQLPMEMTKFTLLGTDFGYSHKFRMPANKGHNMSNNIDFITSIKDELAFEEVVRQVAKYIYDAEAYLSGGSYDGGRDLIYKRAGREVKEAVQITIQEKSLTQKVVADAEKVKRLVDEHNYPEVLTLFWSHTLSATAQLKLKKAVRDATGIKLEIYEAGQLAQLVTEELPETLHFIINEVHKLRPELEPSDSDPRARAFYDYLAMSKESAELKTSIVDAEILSTLYGAPSDRSHLATSLERINIKAGAMNGRVSALIKAGKIESDENLLTLSAKEKLRLDAILQRDQIQRRELLDKIRAYTEKEIGVDIAEQAFQIIKHVYSTSIEVQISEISIEPPKLSLIKNLLIELEGLFALHTKDSVREHTKNLIEIASENDYFANYCSSIICINLLNQRKLQRYIDEKHFFIYLDATVFIQYLCLYGFAKSEFMNRERQIVMNLRDSIRHLKNVSVRITQEHLEETIRHLTQAEKISGFANDALIEKFGDSKNVFFNLYLNAKKKERAGYSFEDFLERLIGFEEVTQYYTGTKFDAFMECVRRYLKIATISVVEYEAAVSLEDNPTAKRILRSYQDRLKKIGKHRKTRSILNDLAACYTLGDTSQHLDKKKVGHTPALITWDSTQHELRTIFRSECPYDEWLVYTPQRATERFSMLQFKMNSEILKDNVLAIIDEDYIRDSSLIDTLAAFLGDDKIESDAIIAILTKLTGKIHNEAIDPHDVESEGTVAINNALIILQNAFRSNFDQLRRLFSHSASEPDLFVALEQFISGKVDDRKLVENFQDLVKRMAASSAGA